MTPSTRASDDARRSTRTGDDGFHAAVWARHNELLSLEREQWSRGHRLIAGLDEVGAGTWAGPVMAGCVILDPDRTDALVGVDDSKKLSPRVRERLSVAIEEHALFVATARATVEEIDRTNILSASLLAMRRALTMATDTLGRRIDLVFVDARTLPDIEFPQRAIVRGDATSLSIAAASIIAKVRRDRVMMAMDAEYPGYGFARHKGYGTREHENALFRLGVLDVHRRSFRPVKEAMVKAIRTR